MSETALQHARDPFHDLGDHILDQADPPPGTASLMIGHEIAGDRRSDLDRVGQTKKRWYFQAQRFPEKTKALEA